MVTIPERIVRIFETPLDVDTCEEQIKIHKLECGQCDRQFDSEYPFTEHLKTCFVNVDTDDPLFQLGVHANRHLMLARRVALYCGASDQGNFLECGICKREFPDKLAVRKHVIQCSKFNGDYTNYHYNIIPLFNRMLFSHEKMGEIFQKFDKDPHIIKIKEDRYRKIAEEEDDSFRRDETGRLLFFDELAEHFNEDYQDYIFAVSRLLEDGFLRYMKRKEKGPIPSWILRNPEPAPVRVRKPRTVRDDGQGRNANGTGPSTSGPQPIRGAITRSRKRRAESDD